MQYGYFYDQSRCTGCRTCTMACESWHDLAEGPEKYLRVYEYEKGAFPSVRVHLQWMPCYHCEEPACKEACPFEAITKEEKYGAVLIDQKKCVGCRLCYMACPYGAPMYAADKASKQPSGSTKSAAPCTEACPAGVNIPQYVGYIRKGKPSEAVATLREKLPFPSVCGRICFHPCETKCNRTKMDDESVSIRALKRYATDHDTGVWKKRVKNSAKTGKKVAIIGSGPAGLTAGYYLARKGHEVTVFEALPKAGGMMRFGIPEYRLPKSILDSEIREIKKAGVQIQLNSRVESIDALMKQGFKAVFLSLGAHRGTKLRVDGEEIKGVLDAVTFLRNAGLGKKMKIGEKVVVIGGGNVAIDAARTALRLGAKSVNMVCLESLSEMPAFKEEVEAAITEGIKINCSWGVEKIAGEGQAEGVECKECVAVIDPAGKFNPKFNAKVKTSFDADTVIAAIGQEGDVPVQFKLKTTRGNTILVNENLETERKGVFAGGDVARSITPITASPASVITAIASGRKAASAIDVYLGGDGNIDEVLTKPIAENVELTKNDVKRKRVNLKMLGKKARLQGFAEVELPMTERAARAEAKRCFECDPSLMQKCDMCIDRLEAGDKPMCVLTCRPRALDFGPMSEMEKFYGKNKDLEDLPSSQTTNPSVVFKPHAPRKQLVPYDAKRALELMARRDPLPPLYKTATDMTEMPDGLVGRSKLVVKHQSAAELLRAIKSDEG
jgi:formate dehydrogenase beta subunit